MAYPATPTLPDSPSVQQLVDAMGRKPDCVGCPPDVVIVCQIYVYRSMIQVRTIKAYIAYFAGLADSVLADAINTIRAIVNAIPYPDALLNSLLNYLTCPLTPLAITALMAEATGEETIWSPAGKSAEAIAQNVRMFFVQYGKDLKARWRRLLRSTPQWRVIQRVVEMVDNLENVQMDAFRLAHSGTICTTVATLCPDLYYGSVFESFVREATGFTMTDIIPGGLRGRINDAARLVAEAHQKLNAWSEAATGRLPFPTMP